MKQLTTLSLALFILSCGQKKPAVSVPLDVDTTQVKSVCLFESDSDSEYVGFITFGGTCDKNDICSTHITEISRKCRFSELGKGCYDAEAGKSDPHKCVVKTKTGTKYQF